MFRRVTLYRVTVVSGKLRRKAVFSRRRTPVRSGHAVPHRIDRGGGKRKYEHRWAAQTTDTSLRPDAAGSVTRAHAYHRPPLKTRQRQQRLSVLACASGLRLPVLAHMSWRKLPWPSVSVARRPAAYATPGRRGRRGRRPSASHSDFRPLFQRSSYGKGRVPSSSPKGGRREMIASLSSSRSASGAQ
jgi:hypothetical protein